VTPKAERELERRVDGLYGAPLEEFTALRNELAKELRGSGDRAAAEEVGRLRKPTAAAWAINQLSHRKEPTLRGVLEAGRKLRKAQESALGGGSGAALRTAGADEREAVAAAAAAASGILGETASKAAQLKVRNSLHAAAGDDDVRTAIEKGRLSTDHEPMGLGPFTASGAAPRRAARSEGKQDAAKRKRLNEAQVVAREATRRADAARRELERRSDAAARAQERLVAAQADLDEADGEAKAAAAELKRAEGGS
jgi:hypothetical protein